MQGSIHASNECGHGGMKWRWRALMPVVVQRNGSALIVACQSQAGQTVCVLTSFMIPIMTLLLQCNAAREEEGDAREV